MRRTHGACAALVGAAFVSVCTDGVFGQAVEVSTASAEVRSFSFSPAFRLADVGWDSNVFRVTNAEQPLGDFTATFTPAARVLLRAPHLRVSAAGAADFVYFKELSAARSIDPSASARVEVPLGRVTPYAAGDWVSARHRRNFEIDLPVRRVDLSRDAGIDVRLSGKTSAGVMRRWSSVEYSDNTLYLDTYLDHYLGGTAVSNGVRVRYAATPLTTVGANVERDRNEFEAAPERNSQGYRVTSVVEFRPLSLVSGRAQIGFRKRTFVDGKAPPFQGTVGRVDVAHTLLGRTRIGVTAQRDLSYSYRADQRDYLQTGVEMSLSHRIGTGWDLGGTLGRFRLIYGLSEVEDVDTPPNERVLLYSIEFGYSIDRTRVGFRLARQGRSSSSSANRDYEEMRIGSSVSYGF